MRFSKTIPFFIILSLTFIQCKKEPSDINLLSAPNNWRKETIPFPLSFAKSIQHRGTEYVRFSPGWGKQGSEEYFSYVFLWYLDNDPQLSDRQLESELEVYFDGLMQEVKDRDETILKAKAFFEKIDDQSFAGKVITYDAFTTKKEVQLNVVVTYNYCQSSNKYLLLFKISPQPIDHVIWDKLHKVNPNIDCI
ncbi:hypothetical protein [Aquimarina sp. SS2-1]|uniref:hypothetical protein n=1 Tax=Aquimarina besae TaxID=3342247 RepID=UPI003670A8E6